MPTLRSRQDFARLEAKGRSRADRLLVVRYVRNDLHHDRYAISTGRRLGSAVRRNRVRRRLREILRRAGNDRGHGWDILVVARAAAVNAPFDELRVALERHLDAIRGSVSAAS